MSNKVCLTVDMHYVIIKKSKGYYFMSSDKEKSFSPVGLFKTIEKAIEDAQHFENEYHKLKKKNG